MIEASSGKPIHYCYQCGKRLRMSLEACWCCGVPVQRQIRPPRRCPFCAEPIRPETIKCPHCGEFLDGRAHVDTRPVRQMIVIDKDLLHAMSDLRLSPGLPVPDSARPLLKEQTIRAIEENKPDQIQEPGVHLLPVPWSAPTPPSVPMLIEHKPEGTGSSEIVLVPTQQPLAPLPPASGVPVRYVPPPAAPPAAPEEPEATVDAEVSDLYRICDICKTEILATDKFCFYCGAQYRPSTADERREALERRRRFYRTVRLLVLLFFVAFGSLGVYLYVKGSLSREDLKSIEQIFRGAVKEKFPKSIEELKTINPKAIWAAEKCRENLHLIQSAKRAAAEKMGEKAATISLEDVLRELKTDKLPVCPTSGTYSINSLSQMPTCSIGDNGTTSTLDDHILSDK